MSEVKINKNLFLIVATLLVVVILFLIWKSIQTSSSINELKSGDYLKQYVNEELLNTYKPYDMKVQYFDGKKLDAKLVNATIEEGNVIGSLELELKTGEKITLDTYRTTVNLTKSEISEITLTELADYEPSDRSISGIKLKLKTVTSEELADGSVVTNKLANASITGGKIQEGVIETNHMGSAIVTEIKIADGAVTTNKILNGTIISEDLANGSITNSKLSSDSVTTDKISDGTIANADLANESIDDAKVSNSAAISWSKISKIGSSLADLATKNSADVTIADSGNYFIATNVEDALAELSGYNSLLGSTYLKVDASNDPVTGTLTLQNTANAQELIVKGNSAQTANLQEWQNSSGGVIANVTSAGGAYFAGNVGIGTVSPSALLNLSALLTGTTLLKMTDPGDGGESMTTSYNSTNNSWTQQIGASRSLIFDVPLGMKFTLGSNPVLEKYGTGNMELSLQTGSYTRAKITTIGGTGANGELMFETRNNSGTVLGIYINNVGNVGIGTISPASKLSINGTSDQTQLSVKGNATQTANLQEWQNSGGTVLANITKDGSIGVNRYFTNDSSVLQAGQYIYVGSIGSAVSQTKDVRGLTLEVERIGSNTVSGNTIGVYGVARTRTTANVTGSISGGSFRATVSPTSGTGVSSNVYGITTSVANENNTGAVITNAFGVNIDSFTLTGAIANSYGLYINNISGATALNYAIFTNAGLNRFGDQISVNGSADRIQMIVRGNTTQTTNLQEWQNSGGGVLSGADERGILFSNGGADASNVYIGDNAGRIAGTGIRNVAIGGVSLDANTTGTQNLALGFGSLSSNTGGNYNTAIGGYSLLTNTTGQFNTAIGYSALYTSNSTGNLAFGYEASSLNELGDYNVAIGSGALRSNVTGHRNIVIGNKAGYRNLLSDRLIIDNQLRADVATEITNSILFGVMAATPATQTLSINAALTVNPQGAAVIPIILKGAASQTANLTEWQNSGGSVLSVINNNGYLGLGTNSPKSQLQLTEYLQLGVISSAPPATDCDEATEIGRMKYESVGNVLYICDDTGWITK